MAPHAARRAVSSARHVRRMDDAPAAVEIRMIEKPFDRPRAEPGDAVGDFADLLGGMDVDRRLLGDQRDDRGELVRS